MFPRTIQDLVERFRDHRESYKSAQYKEAQLREEFINPFWWELGWDMTNRAGLAEAYKEVIHEDSLRIEGAMKAPDYTFRVGSEKKFFLECKAPKVHLATDVAPAYQLKRYAWSAGLSISLLSDFEEFAVYQTTSVPKPTDAPYKDRIEFFNFEQYEEKWDWLVETFSREAVWKGRFDKYAAQAKGKRGTTPFDKQFLADMIAWRKKLAENIALRNKGLSESELNSAVQITLDRIIMLRICEDRKIEQYGNLALDARLRYLIDGTQKTKTPPPFQGGGRGVVGSVYQNLLNRFRAADDRFNSGLFHFRKEKSREGFDALTPRLAIDDKVLTDIIRHLYYPESPYAFDIVPSDILGHVYEQFLGQVITLTKGGNARVEEKPEVKKAGGVYYTPSYIVDYIVKNTVGKMLGVDHALAWSKDKKGQAKACPTPTILDPACGSGSFLLGAYQYLLDWYLKFYLANEPESWTKKKVLDRIPTSDPTKKDYRLSPRERKRILLDHIHGVDIDRNAVEVAKLNLMLKVLEGGESGGSDGGTQRIAYDTAERLLPDLDRNILCGNSLIGTDYYNNPLLFKEGAGGGYSPDTAKINPMDWKQAFPDIMRNGGFDVVIGNPPYVVIGKDLFDARTAKYLLHFGTAEYKADLFQLFIERGIELLKPEGKLGFIVPNPWLTQVFTKSLRKYILEKTQIDELVTFKGFVFESATVNTALVFLSKIVASDSHEVRVIDADSDPTSGQEYHAKQIDWFKNEGHIIETRRMDPMGKLADQILKQSIPLGTVARASLGCQAYNSSKHTKQQIENRVFHADKKLSSEYLPELAGSDVSRYELERVRGQWIKYGPWLHDYRTMDWLQGPRILIREISGKQPHALQATYTEDTYCNYKTILNINPLPESDYSMKYLVGILDSTLISRIYPYISNKMVANAFPRLSVGDLRKIPVPKDVSTKQIKLMEKYVEREIDLHNQLKKMSDGQNRTLLTRQIAGVDAEIDKLVYQLYGLSEEEIRIMEG